MCMKNNCFFPDNNDVSISTAYYPGKVQKRIIQMGKRIT